jgi:hypothetical protein
MEDEKVGYKRPPKSGQIKKGEVRNPNGGRAHYQGRVSSSFKRLTADEVRDIGSAILSNDTLALRAIIKDPKNSVLKVWVASCAFKAITKGDANTLEILLNRFVGRVKEDIQINAVVEVADEDPIVRQKRIEEKLQRLKDLDGV